MEYEIRPRCLQSRQGIAEIGQLALNEVDSPLEMLDVLHATAPTEGAVDFDLLGETEKIVRQVTAGHAGDACD